MGIRVVHNSKPGAAKNYLKRAAAGLTAVLTFADPAADLSDSVRQAYNEFFSSAKAAYTQTEKHFARAYAQDISTLEGQVLNASQNNAPVPNAVIVLKTAPNVTPERIYAATTRADGTFTIATVAPQNTTLPPNANFSAQLNGCSSPAYQLGVPLEPGTYTIVAPDTKIASNVTGKPFYNYASTVTLNPGLNGPLLIQLIEQFSDPNNIDPNTGLPEDGLTRFKYLTVTDGSRVGGSTALIRWIDAYLPLKVYLNPGNIDPRTGRLYIENIMNPNIGRITTWGNLTPTQDDIAKVVDSLNLWEQKTGLVGRLFTPIMANPPTASNIPNGSIYFIYGAPGSHTNDSERFTEDSQGNAILQVMRVELSGTNLPQGNVVYIASLGTSDHEVGHVLLFGREDQRPGYPDPTRVMSGLNVRVDDFSSIMVKDGYTLVPFTLMKNNPSNLPKGMETPSMAGKAYFDVTTGREACR